MTSDTRRVFAATKSWAAEASLSNRRASQLFLAVVSISARRMRSASLTMPTMAPLSSTIGAALTPEPSSSSAASNTDSLTLRRFWNNQPDEHGALIHRRNGSWAFSYASGDDNDEPIFRFDRHLFVEGEYVTVTEHDGVARPFRIVHVAPAVVHH